MPSSIGGVSPRSRQHMAQVQQPKVPKDDKQRPLKLELLRLAKSLDGTKTFSGSKLGRFTQIAKDHLLAAATSKDEVTTDTLSTLINEVEDSITTLFGKEAPFGANKIRHRVMESLGKQNTLMQPNSPKGSSGSSGSPFESDGGPSHDTHARARGPEMPADGRSDTSSDWGNFEDRMKDVEPRIKLNWNASPEEHAPLDTQALLQGGESLGWAAKPDQSVSIDLNNDTRPTQEYIALYQAEDGSFLATRCRYSEPGAPISDGGSDSFSSLENQEYSVNGKVQQGNFDYFRDLNPKLVSYFIIKKDIQ